MTQRHTLAAVCGLERSCRAHWSLNPAGKLLFFVHGFGGDATGAWRRFPQLLLDDGRWGGWDLFFYGYDSRRIRAGISAQLLGTQARNVIEQPGYADAWLLSRRPNDFHYTEIWFITHSLGAAVTRHMLTEMEREGSTWLNACHLICFAPATTGARVERIMSLMGKTSGGLIGFLHSVLRFRWTVLDDLKVDSPFLKALHSDTLAACLKADREPFVSKITLFGSYEDVVDFPPAFQFDRKVRLVPGADHTDVCKPRSINHVAYSELLNQVQP